MPDPIVPDTPGKDITFDKPNIPACWDNPDYSVDKVIDTGEKLFGKPIYRSLFTFDITEVGRNFIQLPFNLSLEKVIFIRSFGFLMNDNNRGITLLYDDGTSNGYADCSVAFTNSLSIPRLNVVVKSSAFVTDYPHAYVFIDYVILD